MSSSLTNLQALAVILLRAHLVLTPLTKLSHLRARAVHLRLDLDLDEPDVCLVGASKQVGKRTYVDAQSKSSRQAGKQATSRQAGMSK